jgi:aminoglycoside phosphotransferase (APT) family kinase protein
VTPPDDSLAANLEQFLSRELGRPGSHVTGLHRASQGLSRENWPFDLEWSEAGDVKRLPLLLRRDPLGSVLETDRRIEFGILKALEGGPIPVPRVYLLDQTGEATGRPSIVMERREGICDYFVLGGGTLGLSLDRRLKLAHELYDTLAEIHAFDWEAAGIGAYFPSALPPGALRELEWWQAYLAQQALEPQPEMAFVADWLRRHAPQSQRTVLVHGDYKAGNVLLTPGGTIDTVLDWEIAHPGDPMEDLGWVTNPYRAPEHTIPGHWSHEDLVARYTVRTGLRVDPHELRYWQVFTNFKLAAIVLTGVRSLCEGRSDRIYGYRGSRTFLGRLLDLVGE